MMNEKLIAMVKKNEGLRLEPYKCSEGFLTIGYGRNLQRSGGGITQQEAEYLLENDVAMAEAMCEREFEWWDSLTIARQAVLIDMVINLGISGLLGFKNMLAAIKARSWQIAGEHLVDSLYAKQVGERAQVNKRMLVTGEWP
jgi:lysozyme